VVTSPITAGRRTITIPIAAAGTAITSPITAGGRTIPTAATRTMVTQILVTSTQKTNVLLLTANIRAQGENLPLPIRLITQVVVALRRHPVLLEAGIGRGCGRLLTRLHGTHQNSIKKTWIHEGSKVEVKLKSKQVDVKCARGGVGEAVLWPKEQR